MYEISFVADPSTSTSRQNRVQIQYLNPSRLKRMARASGYVYMYWTVQQSDSQYDFDNYDLTQLLNTSASYR